VPIGQAEPLAEAICRLAGDEAQRRALGAAAASAVADLYSPDAVRHAYREIGAGLVATASAGR
jgi:glycosyltransferase involved in cell wall biosynthesis